MSLRLVRCPFCGKRFNITGVTAGTRLKCSGCTAILKVPDSDSPAEPAVRFYRKPWVQAVSALGLIAGLAVGLYAARPKSKKGEPPVPALMAPSANPPVVKAKNPSEKPELYFDWDSRVLDAKQKLVDEFGSDRIRFHDGRPYLIAVERSDRFVFDDIIKDYAARLETLYQLFRREFSGTLDLPEVEEVLPVVVLNSRESYDAYTRRHNDGAAHSPEIRGLYEYSNKRIVIYHDRWVPFEVILHEGAHQLVHYYTRRMSRGETTAYWFQEGIGTYFEGFRLKAGTGEIVRDPEMNRQRLPSLKAALENPKDLYIQLHVLVGMSIDEFWGWFRKQRENNEVLAARRAQVFYAESWGLLYFLRTRGGGYRRVFDEYFKLELQGKGGKETFENVVRLHLDMDLPQLAYEFSKFIRELQ